MRVHLDHNATTPLREEALEAWVAAQRDLRGNPSAVHGAGRRARALLDDARERVAGSLRVHEGEVIFTSGGTESDNLAILGVLRSLGRPGRAVTLPSEHSAVLEAFEQAEREGHTVTHVPVDSSGQPDGRVLADAAHGADLVSLQAANNEVGTVLDLPELLGHLGQEAPPWVHTDAVQALGRLPVDPAHWGVHLASFSAHKVGGPVGVGVLVRRGPVPLAPLTHGGGQEGALRPGTEDVASIHAASIAIELAVAEQAAFADRAVRLVQKLWNGVQNHIGSSQVLGPAPSDPARLPNTLALHMPGTDGRTLVARLDLEGLEVSSGSACASGSLEPSHVLRALGHIDEVARAGLRISIGRATTDADIARAVDILSRTLGEAT